MDKAVFDLKAEHFLSLRFTGEIKPRVLRGNSDFKGSLFFAYAGDVTYSKIDVRNGAIGIVPEQTPLVVVTSEFPVYQINNGIALSEYIKLVFRTRQFREVINGMVSGASGRKRVQPDGIEQVEIPMPPLATQQTIVTYWRNAQSKIAAMRTRVGELESEIEERFLSDLGLKRCTQRESPRCFAVPWKDLTRFSVSSTASAMLGLDTLQPSHYPEIELGCVAAITYGLQKCPANRPDQHGRPYLSVANVRKGYLDLTEVKSINVPDGEMPTYRLEPGDILFVEGNGSRSELGRVAMWNGEIANCVHQNHLIKARLDRKMVLPEFAMTWFNTDLGRSHFFRAAKSSSGLGTINSSEVRRAPIPLPPRVIQEQIMARVAEGRAEIAREQEAVKRLAGSIEAEVEGMILGVIPSPSEAEVQ